MIKFVPEKIETEKNIDDIYLEQKNPNTDYNKTYILFISRPLILVSVIFHVSNLLSILQLPII